MILIFIIKEANLLFKKLWKADFSETNEVQIDN